MNTRVIFQPLTRKALDKEEAQIVRGAGGGGENGMRYFLSKGKQPYPGRRKIHRDWKRERMTESKAT